MVKTGLIKKLKKNFEPYNLYLNKWRGAWSFFGLKQVI